MGRLKLQEEIFESHQQLSTSLAAKVLESCNDSSEACCLLIGVKGTSLFATLLVQKGDELVIMYQCDGQLQVGMW